MRPMRAEPVPTWTAGQRRLHWLTAALVLSAFPLGWLMTAVPLQALLLKFLLYQMHKTLGIIVLACVVARLLMRARTGRPDWDAGLPDWQRRAAVTMHILLYAALLAVPMLGYLTGCTAPARMPTLFLGLIPVPHILPADRAWFSVLRPTHQWSAVFLVVLAGGHALASLHNHLRGHASLRRMWSGQVAGFIPPGSE